jgi:hypothetical protein
MGGGGSFDVGYVMTADEIAFWQDQAALLDPAAYVFLKGSGAGDASVTVPSGERYYLLNGWWLQGLTSATNWFHRPAHVEHALLLPEGTTITTGVHPTIGSLYGSIYVCKPSLVTGADSRYTDDPRALYFERMTRLGTLALYQLGAVNAGGSVANATFPTDFTDGMFVHVSSHDVAWLITLITGDAGGINTLNELSDGSPQIRFAEPVLVPFLRTTFPKIQIQGSGLAEGRASCTYVKLPGDW